MISERIPSTTPSEAATPRSIITPRFLLRVGGLPREHIDHLRFTHTLQWQEGLLSLEHQLLDQKEALVDLLHAAVNTHKEDQALRRSLINLKRQVFNMHFPHGTEHARATAAALGTDAHNAHTALNAWLDLWERYQHELTRGPAITEQELQEKRALLKDAFQDPDFRKGVLLSSPVLSQAMDHYLHADNAHPNREARTVERSLLEYLLRTIHKTSPFSAFTPVCIGQFSDTYQSINLPSTTTRSDIELAISNMRKQSFTRLNMLVLSRLSAQILASPPVRKGLRVRLTTGWRQQNEHIRYIRRKPVVDNPDGLDADAALPLDFVQEHVIGLPVGTLLNNLISIMHDGHEEVLGDLIKRLHHLQSDQRAETVIEAYLHHLLRLGFLIVPALQVNIHAPRPLDVYTQQLLTIGTPQTDALAAKLQEIANLIDRYASAPLVERAEIVEHIKQLLQEGSALLIQNTNDDRSINLPSTRANTWFALALPRTIVYEDTTISPEKLSIAREDWSEIFSDISGLQRILPLFDVHFTQRLLTRGYFQARYGQGQGYDDFLAFAERFNSEFLRPMQHDAYEMRMFDQEGNFRGRQDYFGQPEVAAINEARQFATNAMRQSYQAHTDTRDQEPTHEALCAHEMILPDDFVTKLAALVPQQGQADLQSNTFFSQFAHLESGPSLILNQIYPGLTLMFSRFAYCFAGQTHGLPYTAQQQDSVVSALRETLTRLQTPDMVFAELKGGYDATNLNLHPVVTAYELVCPGEISSRPLSEQIPMDDLFIQDNMQTGRLGLYSKRLQKEVVPLYLGFLTPMLLPEIQQVLLSFSYLSTATLDLWNGVQVASSDEVTFYPRLRYKHIVLQRATWKIPASGLPCRESGQSDADFYLQVSCWRQQHALPLHVFVAPDATTIIENSSQDENDKEQTEKDIQSYKPLFVDFENLFSVLLFEATMRKARSSFVLTEVLPQREHLWFQHNQQTHVTEFVFEVSQKRALA